MKISILGCGWFGSALGAGLIAKGNQVKGSTTSADKLERLRAFGILPYLITFPDGDKNDPSFFDCDVMVVSIPPKFRKGEGEAFLPKISSIINAISRHHIRHVVYTSSTGVYGDNQGIVNESDEPQPDDQSGQLLLEAERLFQNEAGFKATIVRFAGLIGPGRDPGRFFAGKTNVPNGLSPVNLVHIDDAIGITVSVIENNAWGEIFNACSPQHPTRAEFYRAAALKAGLPLPEFVAEAQINKMVHSVNTTSLLNYQFK